MRKLIPLALTILLSVGLRSQNSNLDYKTAVKVYNVTQFTTTRAYSGVHQPGLSTYQINTRKQWLHPSVAIQWRTKNTNFHEIELLRLELGNNQYSNEYVDSTGRVSTGFSTGELTVSSLSLRYEFMHTLGKMKERKLVPILGFGLNPYFRSTRYNSFNLNGYSSSSQAGGCLLFIIPRLSYFFSPRWFADLNVPLHLISLEHTVTTSNDSFVLPGQQRVSLTDLEVFPRSISLRLGIGLKF